MMKTNLLRPARTALALAAVALVAACASAPRNNAKLTEARSAYDMAAANAQIVRSAPVELQKAQQALQQADAALSKGDDTAAVDHYAYLARQRTEVAVQAGRIAQADEAASQSRSQRDRILIDARTRDANVQRDAAEQSRMLADQRLAAAEAARQQATAANTRANSLEAQMAALKAKPTDRGMVLTLGDVLFDSGRSTLKPGAMRTVDQLAQFLDKNPSRNILIEGHTDSQGSDSSNRELSLHRAEAVQQALVDKRIPSDRVQVSGLGESYPVASNDSASGRQQNRRVEVIFSDDAGGIKARTN